MHEFGGELSSIFENGFAAKLNRQAKTSNSPAAGALKLQQKIDL
jgi:hypothetical protein